MENLWVEFYQNEKKIYWCKSCLNMSTRPRIQFDKNKFVMHALVKKKIFNWNFRKKELANLIKKYKSKNDNSIVLFQ